MTCTPTTADRLAAARVLIVGLGGLGAPAARSLAAAGVGTLGLIDPDVVEASNLHRQPLYDGADLGVAKVTAAAARLRTLAPRTAVETLRRRWERGDVALLRPYHVIIDGTDSIATKFELNDAAVAAGVPLVHAGVLGLRAQVMTVLPRRTACYRCVFEAPPPPDDVPSCNEAGVLGPLPALAGALQAAEALRLLGGLAPLWADRLLALDLGTGRCRTVPLAPNPRCPTCSSRPREVERSATS
jgi:molybdopterin/thiamine biosynthesis adenylyltransferase